MPCCASRRCSSSPTSTGPSPRWPGWCDVAVWSRSRPTPRWRTSRPSRSSTPSFDESCPVRLLDLLDTYWSMGDLPALCAALKRAGLEIVETRTTVGTVRYGTVENLVETEIKGTPLADRLSQAPDRPDPYRVRHDPELVRHTAARAGDADHLTPGRGTTSRLGRRVATPPSEPRVGRRRAAGGPRPKRSPQPVAATAPRPRYRCAVTLSRRASIRWVSSELILSAAASTAPSASASSNSACQWAASAEASSSSAWRR